MKARVPFRRYCRFCALPSDATPIPPQFWGCSTVPIAQMAHVMLRSAREQRP